MLRVSGAVKYVQVDGSDVAYSLHPGRGDRDLVLMFGGVFPMMSVDGDGVATRFLDGLGELGRVLTFDRRGVGQSGPILDWSVERLRLWTDDLHAVIRDAGLSSPVVLAHGNACPAAVMLASESDDVEMLVLAEPTNPWFVRREQLQVDHDVIRASVRDELDLIAYMAPERIDADAGFHDWFVSAGNLGAGPEIAERLLSALSPVEIDMLKDAFGRVSVPMLVLRRPGVPFETPGPEDDAHLGATSRVELTGRDWLTFLGARIEDVSAEVAEFVTGRIGPMSIPRSLCAVLFTDLGGSTQLVQAIGDARWRSIIDRHDATVDRMVARWGGRVVKTTGDGVLATFPSASGALLAGSGIRDALVDHDLEVRVGVHVGDVDQRGLDISGIAVNVAARVMSIARPGQILATSGATQAASGAQLTFGEGGSHELKGVDGTWDLFELSS